MYATGIHIRMAVNTLYFIHIKLHVRKLNWKKDTKPTNFGNCIDIEKHNAVPLGIAATGIPKPDYKSTTMEVRSLYVVKSEPVDSG